MMHCPQCGFNNLNGANFCSNCGMPLSDNPKPRPPRQTKNRKVVKLPSDHSSDAPAHIERPWEMRVSKHESAPEEQPPSASEPSSQRAAGTTGKIPAIKHPRYESGKIPPEERASSTAASTATYGGAAADASPDDTAPIVLDDYEISSYAASATTSTYNASRSRTPQRRSIRQEAEARNTSGNAGGRKRFLVILIALLFVCCVVALGVFMTGPGSSDKTVTFNTDGGTVIGNQYIQENGEITRPANPTRPGYEFEGWYLDADYSEKAEFPLVVTQDMTLYGKWKPLSSSTPTTTPSTPDSAPTVQPTEPDAGSAGSGASGDNAGSGSSGATRPSTGGGGSGSGSGGSGGGSGSGSGGVNTNPASNGPVNISFIAANGTPLSGTVTLHNGYVIPNSSEKAYTIDELRALGLNDAELCIARNEPYARQGYSFRNPGLQAYFNARSWYHNSGKRFELPEGSAGYITAHNLLTLAEQTPGAAAWLRLRTY